MVDLIGLCVSTSRRLVLISPSVVWGGGVVFLAIEQMYGEQSAVVARTRVHERERICGVYEVLSRRID